MSFFADNFAQEFGKFLLPKSSLRGKFSLILGDESRLSCIQGAEVDERGSLTTTQHWTREY